MPVQSYTFVIALRAVCMFAVRQDWPLTQRVGET
jgi:hypothetical protein